jgi:hypothetical protein
MTSGFLSTLVSTIDENALKTGYFFLGLITEDYRPISLLPIELLGRFLILFIPFI